MDHMLNAEGGKINLSEPAFRLWAKHYYECRLSFQCTDLSPVPYFLLCRAIELQFKAFLLERKQQKDVKQDYGHDLIKLYNDLPAANQTLSPERLSLLQKANKIYIDKGFEYINVDHAAHGFSDWPDLKALDRLTAEIVGS